MMAKLNISFEEKIICMGSFMSFLYLDQCRPAYMQLTKLFYRKSLELVAQGDWASTRARPRCWHNYTLYMYIIMKISVIMVLIETK